ncbi:MAG: hypothetical protein ACYDGR_00960 [Candidatus Dormibacteria bacterium]
MTHRLKSRRGRLASLALGPLLVGLLVAPSVARAARPSPSPGPSPSPVSSPSPSPTVLATPSASPSDTPTPQPSVFVVSPVPLPSPSPTASGQPAPSDSPSPSESPPPPSVETVPSDVPLGTNLDAGGSPPPQAPPTHYDGGAGTIPTPIIAIALVLGVLGLGAVIYAFTPRRTPPPPRSTDGSVMFTPYGAQATRNRGIKPPPPRPRRKNLP